MERREFNRYLLGLPLISLGDFEDLCWPNSIIVDDVKFNLIYQNNFEDETGKSAKINNLDDIKQICKSISIIVKKIGRQEWNHYLTFNKDRYDYQGIANTTSDEDDLYLFSPDHYIVNGIKVNIIICSEDKWPYLTTSAYGSFTIPKCPVNDQRVPKFCVKTLQDLKNYCYNESLASTKQIELYKQSKYPITDLTDAYHYLVFNTQYIGNSAVYKRQYMDISDIKVKFEKYA